MVDKIPERAEVLPGPALGFIETASIARGVEALDALLKRARVEVLLTTIVPRGKYLILFGGGVADVEEALKAGLETAGKSVLDLGRVDLGPAIDAAMESMRAAAEAKGVTVEAVVDPAIGPLRGSGTRCCSILSAGGYWCSEGRRAAFSATSGRSRSPPVPGGG